MGLRVQVGDWGIRWGLEGPAGVRMDGQGLVWEESNSVEFCPLEQDVCVGSALPSPPPDVVSERRVEEKVARRFLGSPPSSKAQQAATPEWDAA